MVKCLVELVGSLLSVLQQLLASQCERVEGGKVVW